MSGLFWEQTAFESKKKLRPMPPIPDTGWQCPTHFPDLSGAGAIAIDVETYDPDLLTKGPGWARGVGHIVGISVGTTDGYRGYFPIRHEIFPEKNLDPTAVLRWLNDQLCNPHQPKVGANITYDLGWLRHEGVSVRGLAYDVQYAEALLDETSKVALEVLGKKYCNEGKVSDELYRWCADFYGGAVNGAQRKNIYRTPASLTGYYAESDVDLPLRIFEKQYPLLVEQGLWDVFMMETELIPLMLDMRFEGVSVDTNKAEELHDTFNNNVATMTAQLDKMVGFATNVNASASLQQIFDAEGLKYPYTEPSDSFPNGQPSFTGDFLKTVEHPVAQLIVDIRKLDKFNNTFIKGYVLDSHINGKLYGQFHQLRSDGGGTRSGRFSSSGPNLQNIPSRDKVWAPKIRGLFIPDQGHRYWRKYDYSQIEYRFLAHFAVGEGSNTIRQKFTDDPKTDYHQAVIDLIRQEAGRTLDRKPAKTINFGLLYGMGKDKLAKTLGLSKFDAGQLFEAYHLGVPFAKATMDEYTDVAAETGKITTIMGRVSRFEMWQQAGYHPEEYPLKLEHAIRKWGSNIQRAHTHKAVNRLLQGSAADMMKMGMLKCYKDGVFAETGIPRLTVHDELNFSDPGGRDQAFVEMKHIMETCIPLNVPVIVDGEIGPDWGHVEDIVA